MADKGHKAKIPDKIVKYSGELSHSEAIYRLAVICFNSREEIKKYIEREDLQA